MNYDYTKIGERIRHERTHHPKLKTQSDLAKAIGLSPDSRQTIGNWENAKNPLTFDDLKRLCNVFDCELGYLLCEYDCKTRSATDIHNTIGLSENAIAILKNINNSPYKETINTLNKLIEHEYFYSLLSAIHTYDYEFNKKHISHKTEETNALANILDCSQDEAIEYSKASSKATITSNFMKIIETLNNTPTKASNAFKRIFNKKAN